MVDVGKAVSRFVGVGAAVATLLCSSAAAPAAGRAGVQPNSSNGSPETIDTRRRITVVLTDVERVVDVPLSVIEASKFGPLPIRREIVAEGQEFDERAAMGEPLTRSIDGMLTTTHFDQATKRFLVGGYEYVSQTGQPQERRPYLEIVDGKGLGLACEFEISPHEEGVGLQLREVLALEADSIYLDAVSESGERVSLVGRYEFRKGEQTH